MKRTAVLVMKYVLYGISLGCTFFVLRCLAFSVGGGQAELEMTFRDFTRQSIGAMIVGIACGGTAVVYQIGRLRWGVKVLIHFCVGMSVFYPTAIFLGWIPRRQGEIFLTILQFLISCAIFMGIWFCFYLFHRREARQINERLRELEREQGNGRS